MHLCQFVRYLCSGIDTSGAKNELEPRRNSNASTRVPRTWRELDRAVFVILHALVIIHRWVSFCRPKLRFTNIFPAANHQTYVSTPNRNSMVLMDIRGTKCCALSRDEYTLGTQRDFNIRTYPETAPCTHNEHLKSCVSSLEHILIMHPSWSKVVP